MSGRKNPFSAASLSEGFSSTPLKNNQDTHFHPSKVLDDGVLSEDENTFSLLSPIYHDSFDSDEDMESSPSLQSDNSPKRCELPKTPSGQPFPKALQPLSAWEMWLVNKAKEDRIKLEKKAEEDSLLKKKQEEQEKEQEQKKLAVAEKIHEWLKTKKEQERNEQLLKQNKELEAMQRQLERNKEIQQKAEQKYKDWLHKKNQEKSDKDRKEKEDAALKAEQERERRQRAEEKFKEWVTKTNEKSKNEPISPQCPKSPYDKSYPSPSFFNPIPWKPIHTPPPEPSPTRKPQKQRRNLQRKSLDFRVRNSVSAAHTLPKR
ncbi:coiled-coil domain-containing protein 34 [Gouania willdenowi]|uniref:Coiled-coil domain-containing protein 34-like n=1 Tax=Gouania willdenowi TaxID=441366 RepID=A0A8C5GGX3_GOUWI|nr:coiled-coil domain-containing protein 34-like [Gouania willdenowi]